VIGVAHYTQHIVDTATRHSALGEALADASLVVGLSGKHHRAQRNATRLGEAMAQVAARARVGSPVALLLGREDSGLPNEALDRCHLVAHIPTNPAYPSLNLAQAALLALYALFQQAGGAEQPLRPPRRAAPPASAALLEDLFADLERSLEAVEFFKTRSRPGIMRSLRAALYRAHLDAREASLLRAVAIEVRRYLHRRGLREAVGPVGAGTRRP
jgi:TrmH family RNA methyltransferase